jgi:Icc-related predicted phosphoesterase
LQVKPHVHVFGHNHDAGGFYDKVENCDTTFINAATVSGKTSDGVLVPPVVFDIFVAI